MKEGDNTFDSSTSSEGIPLDGFTLTDIENAKSCSDLKKLNDFSKFTQFESQNSVFPETSNEHLPPTTTIAIPTAEYNANITPVETLSPTTVNDTDSCHSLLVKRKKIDISTCYKIKNFGQKVEPSYGKENIMKDWDDTDDNNSTHSQAISPTEIDDTYDDVDGISLSSTSSIGTMQQRLAEFNSDMPLIAENHRCKK